MLTALSVLSGAVPRCEGWMSTLSEYAPL